tara:strand:- start:310 stop:651 length:342 start_codon:yes stop_codon:yes gene_type:complete
MKRYIVETLEMTQNFYVIEAESEENARDISQYATDNWHNTLQTTHVNCNELDVDYLKYLQKKPYWNDITTSYNEVRTKYYEDYGIQSNSYEMPSVNHDFSYKNDFFSTLNKIV